METYLVGGAVRDQLLGLTPEERDWVVVGAKPHDLEGAGFKRVGKDFPVFLHPETGEEYALARRERKSGHGYHGFSIDASPEVTLEQDLARRDLTINAMAQGADGRIIDPFDGRADLAAGLLRHVSSAFVEDPLRVLRVARFAARLAPRGFAVAAETRALMSEIAARGELRWLAAERIWREVQRALEEPAPTRFFDELIACGALTEILAELEPALAPHARGRRALACAADAGTAGETRFAALAHGLDADGPLTQLCRRLPVPKGWAELARLAALWSDALLRACKAGADDLWAIVSGCDALRRPQRFHRLLEVAECVERAYDDEPPLRRRWRERLEEALAAASSVEGGTLARAGWHGAALGRELERRRRQAIADRLGCDARASG